MKSLCLVLVAALICCSYLPAQTTEGAASAPIQQEDEQFKAADQSLLLIPTAYTMPQGKSTFTDYELIIVQYAYGLTPRTHISIGMPFPVAKEMFDYSALGVKQNYLKADKLQAAAIVSYNPHFHTGFFGSAFSYGNPKTSLHADIFWSTEFARLQTSLQEYLICLGCITALSPRVSLMTEIISYSELLKESANGIWTIGVRVKGDRVSWDIGGIRLLQDNPQSLILIPLLKVSVLF